MRKYIETLARDPKSGILVQTVYAAMNSMNLNYEKELGVFEKGVNRIYKEFSPEIIPLINNVLTCEKNRMDVNLAFLFWLGVFQNLACYLNPSASSFIDLDFEDIHLESYMNSLKEAELLDISCHSLILAISPEKYETLDFISSYYCYLETFGYKIAHFMGFLLGNNILNRVYSGYTPNVKLTKKYASMLQLFFYS